MLDKFKKDPVGAYVQTVRELRTEKALEETLKPDIKKIGLLQIKKLELVKRELGKTELIEQVKEKLAGYKIGDRSIYRELFGPLIKPMIPRRQS